MRKWTICQFEWHRDNKILLRLKEQQGMLFFEDGFLISILPLILSRRQDAEDRLSYLLEPV